MLTPLAKLGLGGRAGTGRQYLSWLHWEDMNRVFEAALDWENLEGVFNVCAPQPATNAEFMRELRRVLRRPWSPPVHVWAVRLGCGLMKTEPCLALGGRRCVPERLLQKGFTFQWPTLAAALNQVYAR
jgi:NAD dependent epimerase/dehydratase family enzyme